MATKTDVDVAKATVVQPKTGILDTIRNLFKITEFVILLIVLVLLIVGAIINPRFLGIDNIKIMTRDTAILAIVAIGVGFTILTAGIDLSVGSIVGLGGVMSA
jgi:ribose/xylose/arabinose/galactoside ABC-type transport system permease subunit